MNDTEVLKRLDAVNCICLKFKLKVCRGILKNENAKQIKIISLRNLAKKRKRSKTIR